MNELNMDRDVVLRGLYDLTATDETYKYLKGLTIKLLRIQTGGLLGGYEIKKLTLQRREVVDYLMMLSDKDENIKNVVYGLYKALTDYNEIKHILEGILNTFGECDEF